MDNELDKIFWRNLLKFKLEECLLFIGIVLTLVSPFVAIAILASTFTVEKDRAITFKNKCTNFGGLVIKAERQDLCIKKNELIGAQNPGQIGDFVEERD